MGVVGGLEQLFYFALAELDLHVVAVLVLLEIHGVRVACIPDKNRRESSFFSVGLEGEIGPILSDSTSILGHKARGNYVCELIETHF
ncbi:hypothetical protein C485_01905 [Natrinema altunense JCM 12890]|uniref:Uncharacterized protein n=1 Tax=Natrinema altunense (strain JCM 12890 / CGMCC 1.3731 / AJ2) TaxID=1227494 RepID=L9ZXQ5_NATA2|nr:hypothetical protein C485_01905 [Natrinema altunense JCM 12890]